MTGGRMLRVDCAASTVWYIRHVIDEVRFFADHALSRRALALVMEDKDMERHGGNASFLFPQEEAGAFARMVVCYGKTRGNDVPLVRSWHIADYMLHAVRADTPRQDNLMLSRMCRGRAYHAGLSLAYWKSELSLAVDDVVVLRQGKPSSLSVKDNEELYVGDYSDFEVPLAVAVFGKEQVDDVLYAGLPLSCAEGYGKDAVVLVAVLPRYPKGRREYWKRRTEYENIVRVNA